MTRVASVGLAAIVATVLAVGGALIHHQQPTTAPATTPPPATLTGLTVAADGPLTGYSRTQFGPTWGDVDGNGCDTRNDVLARDLTSVTRDGTCKVAAGTLNDPYTSRRIPFTRGVHSSSAVQIDHVVPLADAWRTGARTWTAKRREEFANDPSNLLAVDGPTNAAKGDSDASQWMPPNRGEWCDYARRQVAVKTRYALTVTSAERDALARALTTCPASR